jgi:serine acetyltransferase
MLSKIFNFMINGFSIEWMYYHSISYRVKGGIYKYISIYLTTKIERKFGCYLSPRAEIGKNLKLKHPFGIIIGEGVKIGNNVTM